MPDPLGQSEIDMVSDIAAAIAGCTDLPIAHDETGADFINQP